MVKESPAYMGATAGYSNPVQSSWDEKATPQDLPFLLKLSVPYNIIIKSIKRGMGA